MSKTATFTTSAVSEWVKLFPRQVTETHTSSVTFMKQLTTIAFGTILHTKNLFPADSFLVEKFCGMEVMSLKKICNNEVAQFVSEALIQAFDAFDKKYLDQLVICFYEGECRAENILEYYVFQYTYEGAGAAVALELRGASAASCRYTFEHVRHSTEKMIQTCVLLVTQFGRTLPSNYDVSLRLYYNHNAPEGYQAPGYESGAEEQDPLAPTLEEAIHLGTVHTPFHELSTHLYIKEDANYSREAIATQNPPMVSQIERESFNGCSASDESARMDSCVSDSQQPRVQCPCALTHFDEDARDLLLTCQYCGCRQHSVCYGLVRDEALRGRHRDTHCCVACWDHDNSRTPTDRRLAALARHRRPFLCVFRRVLEWCARGACVTAARVARCGAAPPHRYLKLLASYGVAPTVQHDAAAPRPIIHEQLKKVMPRFFYNNNQHIVDRLIAETKSHDATRSHNPVDETLTAAEKVDLQSNSTIGHLVNPEHGRVVDDTLKEYRDAIAGLNMREDSDLPPLSIIHNTAAVEALRKRTDKRKLSAPRGTAMGTKLRKSNDSSCRKVI